MVTLHKIGFRHLSRIPLGWRSPTRSLVTKSPRWVAKAPTLPPKSVCFLTHVYRSLNPRYSRGGLTGEGVVVGPKELWRVAHLYSEEESHELFGKGGDDVQSRMRIKISDSYLKHMLLVPATATAPNPISAIVSPRLAEVANLAGDADPSNQNRYSPIPGLLDKYGDIVLAMVSINCSGHCRYCYRLDLFSGISGKQKADMERVAAYILEFNRLIGERIESHGVRDAQTGVYMDCKTGEPLIPIREILFSGGDPLTLPNATLARYLVLMAESGVTRIRLGTKELAFNPGRCDWAFFEMLDQFHALYPEVHLDVVGHYTHPYEIVNALVDAKGAYTYDLGAYKDLSRLIREDLREPLAHINARRDFIGHWNQFPLISEVNDSPEVLRLMAHVQTRLGILSHNIYACREIKGNEHFRKGNDIPRQRRLIDEAQIGLSGLENHFRLIMSTEWGKMEVLSTNGSLVYLKLNRFVHGKKPESTLIIVDTERLDGKKFYWLTRDVLDKAIVVGREALLDIDSRDTSFVATLKREAASRTAPAYVGAHPNITSLTIEILSSDPSSRKIVGSVYIRLNPGDTTTLSQVLQRTHPDQIPAVCGHKGSCLTCVAAVTAKPGVLPEARQDELDLVDTLKNSDPNLRATCCIPLASVPSSQTLEVRLQVPVLSE